MKVHPKYRKILTAPKSLSEHPGNPPLNGQTCHPVGNKADPALPCSEMWVLFLVVAGSPG